MICYFDCFSGISGDMVLGALVDAGLSPRKLKSELSRLPITEYQLRVKKVERARLRATKVDVVIKPGGRSLKSEGRKWKDIKKIINTSTLSKNIKQKGLDIFKRLFEVEAKVHGKQYDRIHLHELGAVDSIVDIFGTLIGIDILGIKEVYSSPINLGSGQVNTDHGVLPVPAPATSALLLEIPVYSTGVPFELTTPTGALLISSLAQGFGSLPSMRILKVGTGAGKKNMKDMPNVLRFFVGTKSETAGISSQAGNSIVVIETNIDDMNPQAYEYVVERLFQAGALDVYLTQVIMKKGRPGIKLTVLCSDEQKDNAVKIIFRETTSIGLRLYQAQREVLDRTVKSVTTKFGKIKVKVSTLNGDTMTVTPEYDDCRKIAKKYDVPVLEVIKSVKVKSL
ncbi:nickel pincer cofactor biosynthesis protein LarC [bacterium]|nr:MAG: nickel pincer cofactor biosynthesis protein LarC [bacterium]